MTSRLLTDLPRFAALAALYPAAALFVNAFFHRDDLLNFVWLVFGPAMAAVFLMGNRVLVAVLIGSLAGFLVNGQDVAAALNGSLRHTFVVWAGMWMLRAGGRFDPGLRSLSDYLRIFGVACGMGLLAAAAAHVQVLLGMIPSRFTFPQFFSGVMLATLVGAPFFFIWRNRPDYWDARTLPAAALILGLSFLVGQVVFLDWLKESLGQVARGYWMFLLVTWAAVRLGPHGAVLVIAATAIQGLVGAQFGTGFFSNDIAKTHLANYFFYMLCLSAVGMALATYFLQRRQAMQDLERHQLHLEDLVAERTARVETLNRELATLNAGLEATVAARTRALDAKVGELDRVNDELARKNEEMEGMIYTASHDLRSPLVNIQGFSQRLEKAAADIGARLAQPDVPGEVRASLARVLDERIPAALGFIRSSSVKMDTLINGLLRLSRVGRAPLTLQALDMNAMLREIAGTLTIQTQQAGATLTIADLPGCTGDPVQLNQVFTNLIDNAIKYRDPARPLRILVSGSRVGNVARYDVKDSGRGIADDYQPKVWQLFHRLDPNGPVPGEGLGLTLVRRIVERHQGHVYLASQPGEGSIFTIELPAQTETAA